MNKYFHLLIFFLWGITAYSQTFTTIIPHPNESDGCGIAETSNQNFIVVSSQSRTLNVATHSLKNTLKVFKIEGNTGLIMDSLEWAAPYENWGIAQIVNITENFPIEDIFILSGSINSPLGEEKQPFFIWIDNDLNIIKDTLIGLPNRKEVFYENLILNDSTILWHGCIIPSNSTDCSAVYQIEMDLEGNILAERLIEETEGYLETSHITELNEHYVLHDFFAFYTLFLNKETYELEYVIEDPFMNNGTPYVFWTDGISYVTKKNTYVVPGTFSWLNMDLESEEHHGYFEFDSLGNYLDTIILSTSLQTSCKWDNFIVNEDYYYCVAYSNDNMQSFYEFGLLQKLTPEGEIIWEKYITVDGYDYFVFFTFEQTSDGGFILVGEVFNPFVEGDPDGDRDVCILKLDSEGNLNTSTNEVSIQIKNALIYPTLIKDEINVQISDYKDVEMIITNLEGREVKRFFVKDNRSSFDVSNLSQGVYFASLYKSEKLIQVEKLIR